MHSILGNTRKADITFHSSGRISISSRVTKLLSLTSGDVIDIIQGDVETYLYVKHRSPLGRHEGMVFFSNKKGHHLVCHSIKLSRYILQVSGSPDKVRLCCGSPVDLQPYGISIPIIIKNKL